MLKFPSKTLKILCLLCCLAPLFFLNACKEEKLTPKYVFFFIGDGASFAQRRITEIANGSALLASSFPVQGIMASKALDTLIPDSAATASAFATGQNVPNGMVSTLPEIEEKLPLITDLAAKNGFKTAVVTTASVDDATPAAFYARAKKRFSYYDIAVQLPESSLSLLAGAKFKRPRSFKKDDLDVVLRRGGYKIFKPAKDNISYPSGKVAVTYDAVPFAMDARKNSPDLAEMVEKTVAKLGTKQSFFIVAESAKIDVAAHMHDTAALIKEMIAFDKAVTVAYDFYKAHPNDTLIVVTGDHETGGLTIGANNASNIDLTVFDKQKKSASSFLYDVLRFKSRHTSYAVLEDFMPTLTRVFGLKMFSPMQKEELMLKETEGDEQAAQDLKSALTPSEISVLREGLRHSLTEKSRRPKTPEFKEKYSDYDPVTIAVMNVLNKRAGIGYTTFEHTAATVPVSAVGYKADLFAGSYESTDIFSKLLNVMGIVLPQPPATPVAPTADGAPAQEQPLPSEVSENAPASPETQNVTK